MVDIHISSTDLNTPQVAEVLAREAAATEVGQGEFIENIDQPVIHNPMFYYSLAAAIMAFVAWAIIEPFFDDMALNQGETTFVPFLLFPITAGLVGLGLGIVYGIANRNPRQAAYCGALGLGIGLLAAIPASLLAGIAFGVGVVFTLSFLEEGVVYSVQNFPPLAFFTLICTRSLAWALVAPSAGLSLGVALKSKKLLSVGIIGGIIGGAVGGLFFDPVDRFLSTDVENAWLSRMVGLTAVGFMTGLFIGYVENLSRTAWLQMLRGPLKGKQFNLFKSPMNIGSSPQTDIYLFKDPDISPMHASITALGAKFLLTDLNSQSGVFVNGRRVNQTTLQKGDVVTLGQTALKYDEKERKK